MAISKWDTRLIDNPEYLKFALGTFFEPSPILNETLIPNLRVRLEERASITSWNDLISQAQAEISTWNASLRSAFIAGHPRIGEVSNLSALSAAEQASKKTPADVLARLTYLNAAYERAFPGLRYITFVAGRTRTEIVPEIEAVLGIPAGEQKETAIHDPGSDEWTKELDRALEDVIRIGRSRVAGLGLE